MSKPSHATGGKPRADARRPAPPGEDPGTLTDEAYLSDGGPDALDAASPPPDSARRDAPHRGEGRRDDRTDDRTDDSVGAQREAHADSPPQTQRRTAGEDPERADAAEPE